jgi:hypothetical protein
MNGEKEEKEEGRQENRRKVKEAYFLTLSPFLLFPFLLRTTLF